MENIADRIGILIGPITAILVLFQTMLTIRKQLQEDKTLSEAMGTHKFRLAFIIIVIGLTVVFWPASPAVPQTSYIVTVEINDVENDVIHSVLESKQFNGTAEDRIPNGKINEMGQWIESTVAQMFNMNSQDVQLYIRIPPNQEKEKINISTAPPIELKVHYSTIQDGRKIRIPAEYVDEQALKKSGKNFIVTIEAPGYMPWVSPDINSSEGLEEEAILPAIRVSIGIEDFKGDTNSNIARRLTDYLSRNDKLMIKGPDALKVGQDELKALNERKIGEEELNFSQMAQTSNRKSLGVDLIVSGDYVKLE